MAAPKGQAAGVRNPYSLRVGLDLLKFRGTNTHGDPGSIGKDQFQKLENVSFDGTRWGSRDGMSKVNSASAMTGCVFGAWDDDDGPGFGGAGAVRVYGSSFSGGGSIYAYDSELTTVGQLFKQNPLETSIKPQAILDVHEEFAALRLGAVAEDESAEENLSTRFFIAGSAGRVYEWVPTVIPEGKTLLDTSAYPKHILTLPGLASSDEILSFAWWEGVLYILTENGSDLEVYSFDGETVTLEVTQTSATVGVLGVWNGEILFATTVLNVRSVAGAWSSLTWPAKTLVQFTDITEFGASAYIATMRDFFPSSFDLPLILVYDGTTVSIAREVPFGPTSRSAIDSPVLALVVFDDKLCYLYNGDHPEDDEAWANIGTYDDSTWVDSVKTFKGTSSPNEDTMSALGMVVSKGSLVVMLNDSPDGGGDATRSLQAAPGTNIGGTWTTLDSETPNSTLDAQAKNGGLTAA